MNLKPKDVRDYFAYITLAMECLQELNTPIDLAQHIIIKNKLGFPSTYGEIFEILWREGHIPLKSCSS